MASEYTGTTNFLQDLATEALQDARFNAYRIHDTNVNPSTLRNPKAPLLSLTKPKIGPPPAFSDLFDGDSTESTVTYMNERADEFTAKYFPAINGSFKNVPEDWLAAIIGGQKPLGHSQTYFDLVWHSARDRAQRTKRSELRSVEASFSARGFTLPPGAMVGVQVQIEASASDAVLEVNVQAALKDADIKLDLLKFAVSEAAQLKRGIMSALADFYRMWLTLPDKDIERARMKAQAQSALYGALSTYYEVEMSFEKLKLQAQELAANVDLSVDKNRISALTGGNSGASALGQAVNAFAKVAADAAQAGGSLTAQIESL
jgi:hypothetical protein